MQNESEIQQIIQIEAAKQGTILLRNNSGALTDKEGRLIRYGLGHTSNNQQTKSSDLIGITSVIVTKEMVGSTIGVFTAIEVKSPNWKFGKTLNERERHQKNFIDWVISRGGIAGFANSIDSFRDLIKNRI